MMNRRSFVKNGLSAGAGLGMLPSVLSRDIKASERFKISLSQWGFQKSIFGESRSNYKQFIKTLHENPDGVLQGDMDPRNIVVMARKLGLNAVDLVNVLWFGHGTDTVWLNDWKRLAKDEGVSFVCLMCDQVGKVGASNKSERQNAIEGHSRWLDTAAELGCTQLRVNPYGDGSYLEQLKQGAETLHELSSRSEKMGIQLLVENHGHPGSNGAWLAMLIELTAHSNIGVFLDFDNFFMGGWNVNPQRRYDRKQGIIDLAPYALGISAKTHDFLPDGRESTIDYSWCIETVLSAGFKGYMSAEKEGQKWSDWEGAQKTIELLKKSQN